MINIWYQIWYQIAFKKEDGRLASSLLNIICCQKWYQIFMHYMDQVGISFISVFIWIYTFFSRNSTRVILAMSHHTIRVSNDLNQAIFTTFTRNTIFVGAIQVKAIIPIIFGIFSSLPCSWVISKLVGFVPEKLENLDTLGTEMFGVSPSKTASGEVGVWLPWWCPALVLPAPGSWGHFLNLIIFS